MVEMVEGIRFLSIHVPPKVKPQKRGISSEDEGGVLLTRWRSNFLVPGRRLDQSKNTNAEARCGEKRPIYAYAFR